MNPQQPHTLPEGWEMKRLSEVTDPKRPVSYGIVQTGELIENGVKCVRVVDLVDGKIDMNQLITTSLAISNQYKRTITKTGDIIFALRGKIGDSAIISSEQEGINLTRGVALIAPSKGVDSIYLKQQIASPLMKSVFIQSTGGSALQEIAINVLRKIKIPLPPLPEQRRIATVLGTWDRAIEQTTDLLKQLRTRHRGLMQRLLTGKMRLPGFEGEWQAVKLGDVFKERSQIGYHNLPLLSITAEQGVINRDELVKRNTSNEDKSKYKRICRGDIGYNTMRMWQGRSAVSSLEGIVSPAYTIITPKSNADVQYMGHLFKFPDVIHRFYRNSQGLVDDTLNCKFPEFAKVRVSIPPTVNEQHAIARVLDASLREIRQQESKLNALREQKRGLMQCLLTGQVRVPGTILAQETI